MVLRNGMAATATATIQHHQTSTPMSLMSCVRESSPPLQDLDSSTEQEIDKNETSKKRRFHPFRGLRKMFRRKVRHSGGDEILPGLEIPTPESETPNMDSHRSRSTSELLASDELVKRKSGTGGLYGGHGGLSVSHDSVFTGDPHSGSDLELDTAQSSSSLSIQQLVLPGVRAELLDAVRRRRGREDTSEDDEDLGLPRSPCNSPTTADILLEKSVKDHNTKSHSTCSDGSLLSMGSSEMDEDSFGLHSRHSSKVSLHEKKTPPITTTVGIETESELDLGDNGSLSTPLSHSAARHKMAVRPKRTHGAPRRRRVQQLSSGTALPTTPEVNEETVRSATPEVSKQDLTNLKLSNTSTGMINSTSESVVTTEIRLKSSSLPPGLALSTAISSIQLSRSRSNAATSHEIAMPFPRSTSHENDLFMPTQSKFDEEDEDVQSGIEKKKEESFFGRLLSRRSGKKKKEKNENNCNLESSCQKQKESIFNAMNIKKRIDEKGRYTSELLTSDVSTTSSSSSSSAHYVKVSKSGPAARQRIEPIDLPPASPELKLEKSSSPTSPLNTIPFKYNYEIDTMDSHNGNSSLKQSHKLEIHSLKPDIIGTVNEVHNTKTLNENLMTSVSSSHNYISIQNENHQQNSIIKKDVSSSINIGTNISKLENKQFRSVNNKNSSEKLSCSLSNNDEVVFRQNKRMDIYSTTFIETTSKVENEQTMYERSSREITSHPRQRQIDSAFIESPPSLPDLENLEIEESQMFSSQKIPYSTRKPEFSDLSRMHISYSSPPHSKINLNENTSYLTSTKSFDNILKTQPFKSCHITKPALSSYQPKISQFDDSLSHNNKTDYGFASLSHIETAPPIIEARSVIKSHSFKHNILPKRVSKDYRLNNSTKLDDAIECTKKFLNAEKEYCSITNNTINKIIEFDSYDCESPKRTSLTYNSVEQEEIKSISPENLNSVHQFLTENTDDTYINEGELEQVEQDEKSQITVSCNNSINTKKQEHYSVTLSVKTSDLLPISCTENNETEHNILINNNKPHLKRGLSNKEKVNIAHSIDTQQHVPEFLKIQLNKVDIVKSATNVVLATNVKEDRSSAEIKTPKTVTSLEINTSDVKLQSKLDNSNNKEKISDNDNDNENEKNLRSSLIESFKKDTNRASTEQIKAPANFELLIQKSEPSTPTDCADRDITWKNGSLKKRHFNVTSINNNTTPSSPNITKPFIVKKSTSLELIETNKKEDVFFKKQLDNDNGKLQKAKENEKKGNSPETVILRKKSMPASTTIRNEEPELMKVFARRSLKLNGENETLGQQVLVMLENIDKSSDEIVNNKSRDSDKENEADSPREERKNNIRYSSPIVIGTKDTNLTAKPKEILTEFKSETTDTSSNKISTVSNIRLGFNNKFSKIINQNNNNSLQNDHQNAVDIKEANKTLKLEKLTNNSLTRQSIIKDMAETDEIINKANIDEIMIPKFKRIQQRKEEWEKRAQQAMKRSVP